MDADKSEEITCRGCGTVAEATPVTWAVSLENGSTQYFCERCVRENIRAIEGRLDSDLW
jgi:MinD superfamily P-loop ATPase